MGNRDKFNPILIIYQIIAIQSLFYLCFTGVLEVFHFFFGIQISYDIVFSDAPYAIKTNPDGVYLIFALLIGFICGSVLISCTIQKAKKCLDYGCTILILHYFCTIWHLHSLPSNLTWYTSLFIGGIGMVLLAEYLCVKIEMQEIPLAY